jgi:hypothetical protein
MPMLPFSQPHTNALPFLAAMNSTPASSKRAAQAGVGSVIVVLTDLEERSRRTSLARLLPQCQLDGLFKPICCRLDQPCHRLQILKTWPDLSIGGFALSKAEVGSLCDRYDWLKRMTA